MAAKIIGLSGMAGAGKDYAFDLLHKTYHHRLMVKRIALADEVRMEIENTLTEGSEVDELPAVWSKPYPDEIRWLLQQWGTELRRAKDKNYWVDRAFETIEAWGNTVKDINGQYKTELLVPVDLWVFTDVRFDNEAQAIKDAGGIIVEVQAPQGVRARRLGGVLPPNHASEEIDFKPDAYLINESDHHEPTFPSFVREYLG